MAEDPLDSLLEVDGVEGSMLTDLREAGFDSLEGLATATRNDLRDIESINTSRAVNILRYLEREYVFTPRTQQQAQRERVKSSCCLGQLA
jgi:ERCC4-type nuclease